MTTSPVPQAKILRVLFMMRVVLAEPRCIEDIASLLNLHVRTAQRYLALIKTLGIEVKTCHRGVIGGYKIMYYIEQCPCCGKKKD